MGTIAVILFSLFLLSLLVAGSYREFIIDGNRENFIWFSSYLFSWFVVLLMLIKQLFELCH